MVIDMTEMTNSPKPDYITPGEAARIAYLTPKTLSRLADEGKITSIRPGRHRRYLRADIEALIGGAA